MVVSFASDWVRLSEASITFVYNPRFFDSYADEVKLLVTGSSRLDEYRRAGDSLMGCYLFYHMHLFSIANPLLQNLPDPHRINCPPQEPDSSDMAVLWEHRACPEPFIKCDRCFSLRWKQLRRQQLICEEL